MKPKRLAFAVGLPLLAVLLGAERDLGTGYRLENVEVLDPEMRLEEARRYMLAFNEALSLECRDCHDLQDFPSDEKDLKLVARDMMRMQRELNERWLGGRGGAAVTCWTCHRGSRRPAAAPGDSLAARPGPGPDPPPAPGRD